MPDLERQMSSLSTSSSTSFSNALIYKPVSGKSELDNHLLYHQKGSKQCKFCKACIPTQSPSIKPSSSTNSPSASKSFRTFHSKTEHVGQHSNCSECMDILAPRINMMNYTLPRANKEKTATLSQRSLGPGNFTPSFKKNTLVADLDFVQYRKTDAEKSPDIIRLQNYSNYQSVFLAQNLHDIAQDVVKTKTHANLLHSEINAIEHKQYIFRKT